MRAHKNTFYFLQLIGYSVILLYFYAIGLLFLGFGSLSDGHYLYKQRYFLFYLCRLAYVFLDSIPSFLCEQSCDPLLQFCIHVHVHGFLSVCPCFKSVKFLIHAISVSYGWMRLNGEIFGKVDSLLVNIFLAKETNGIIQ